MMIKNPNAGGKKEREKGKDKNAKKKEKANPRRKES